MSPLAPDVYVVIAEQLCERLRKVMLHEGVEQSDVDHSLGMVLFYTREAHKRKQVNP